MRKEKPPSQKEIADMVKDMIVAYKSVKGTSCAKCGKTLDNAMTRPTARRSKQVAVANESTVTVWQALHESCV